MGEGSSTHGYFSSLLTSVQSNSNIGIVPEDRSSWENLSFPFIDSTYDFYRNYATQVGFIVRKHWRSKCESCDKRGFKDDSSLDPENDFSVDSIESVDLEKMRENEICTACLAYIRIKLFDDGCYRITSWNIKHNHPVHPKEHTHLLDTKINPVQTVVVVVNSEVGISIRSSYELFSRIGNEKVGFRPIDLKNYLSTVRQLKLEHGERICDYRFFGDVLSFDTTFRTNNLYRPLAAFIGFNHHRQICIFGAALLFNETADTFRWLFQTFSNICPQISFQFFYRSMSSHSLCCCKCDAFECFS
ncbi:hypothetical protein LIER_02029 [Lithospermum erythrorhizon]|uniref:Protein FAR1-RELATED SEQUENCE n=1 Tax=Lithospermum erythrorhizon TaxID=34254 RepID=A0AAV3NPB3_LITER